MHKNKTVSTVTSAGELLLENVSRSRCQSNWRGKRYLLSPGSVGHLILPLLFYHRVLKHPHGLGFVGLLPHPAFTCSSLTPLPFVSISSLFHLRCIYLSRLTFYIKHVLKKTKHESFGDIRAHYLSQMFSSLIKGNRCGCSVEQVNNSVNKVTDLTSVPFQWLCWTQMKNPQGHRQGNSHSTPNHQWQTARSNLPQLRPVWRRWRGQWWWAPWRQNRSHLARKRGRVKKKGRRRKRWNHGRKTKRENPNSVTKWRAVNLQLLI